MPKVPICNEGNCTGKPSFMLFIFATALWSKLCADGRAITPKNKGTHFVITETLLSFTIALKKSGLREYATNEYAKVVKKVTSAERVYNWYMQ